MSELPAACLPPLEGAAEVTGAGWDCLVLVLPSFKYEKNGGKMAAILNFIEPELREIVRETKDLDAASSKCITLVQVRVP